MSQLLEKIDKDRLPRHIAIIMDGNGRWAKEQGHDRLFGHFHGVESVRNIVEGCAELGIQYLTLYAFSTENWDRPEYEVIGLMLTKVDTTKTPKQVLNQLRTDVNVLAYQIQNWQTLAGQAYENKQQQLLAPLYNKAITAVRAVAKEKGYAYVLSKDAFLVAPDGDDMLPAVAAKLGVKIPAGMTTQQPRPVTKPNQ